MTKVASEKLHRKNRDQDQKHAFNMEIPTRLPPPANWQDFERACLALWSEIWADPTAKLNGRAGQPQAGIDVVGGSEVEISGVQCRLKNQFSGATLTKKELRSAAKDAMTFKPELSSFILATTAAADQKIDLIAREISKELEFNVRVWGWEDIENAFMLYRDACRRVFGPGNTPQIFRDGYIKAKLNPAKQIEMQVRLLFSEPEIAAIIAEDFRLDLENLIIEIAMNAFRHGSSRDFLIEISAAEIKLVDDGTSFDPLEKRASSGGGLTFVQEFLSKWAACIKTNNVRENEQNMLSLQTARHWNAHEFKRCNVETRGASLLAGFGISFPPGCRHYTWDVADQNYMASDFWRLLHNVLNNLPTDSTLTIRFSEGSVYGRMTASHLVRMQVPADRVKVEM